MVFRRFSFFLAVRVVLVGLAIAATMWLLLKPGYNGATFVAGSILLLFAAELWRFVSRTNRELARFLDAARYADFSQRFSFDEIGTGFSELGAAFTDILERMRREREGRELEVRRLNALIEHIPVPLLTLHSDDSITLQNNASRRLFGAIAGGESRGRRVSDVSASERPPSNEKRSEAALRRFHDEDELERVKAVARKHLAFYGSTPAYLPTLACHGWEELHGELNRLSKQGRWDAMADLVDDDVLETIAVVGPRREIAPALRRRLAGIADGVSLTNNRAPDPELWADVVSALKAETASN